MEQTTVRDAFSLPTERLLMNTSPDLTLWYGDLLVGHIRSPFYSDATWYGTIDKLVDSTSGKAARTVANYIEFCANWNERTRNDPSNPPDPGEFEQYGELISSRMWATKSPEGHISRIADAPIFFVSGEVSWRLD